MVTVNDDGVLFAKNSDRDPNEAQVLDWRPAADHAADERVRCTWIDIPQVSRTHAVLLSRPWWMWGAEMGANEHGVVIGNEAVFTKQPDGEPALLGMDLLRLGLERGASAEAAAQVIVDLLERHGQGGRCSYERPGFSYHNSFIVADPDGAVVVETAGQEWATEPVLHGARSISNGLTIAGFADAHANKLKGRVAACAIRRDRTEASAGRATTPADLMAALRDHGDRVSPRWSPVNGAMAGPCVHAGGVAVSTQTTSSWVADLRDRNHPQHWSTATGAPCTSLFKPVRVDEPLLLGPEPTNHTDTGSLWWRHEQLHRLTLTNHGTLLPRYRHARDRTEAAWMADPPSGQAAFAQADRLEAAWLHDLRTAGVGDDRPRWLRRAWAKTNAVAGFDPGSGTRPAAKLSSSQTSETPSHGKFAVSGREA